MENFNMGKTGKRRYAKGQGLQMARAYCRACHPELRRDWPRFFKFLKRGGQHIAEYAFLITAISVALTVMYIYTKRGLQAVIKDKVDVEIGPQFESAPKLGVRELQNSFSISEVVSKDESRMERSNAGGMRYTLSSTSSASGNAIVNSGQIFVPENPD